MTLSLRRKAATAIATSSLLVGAGVALSPGTAYAGSNGQQIIACDYLILYGAVRVTGANQDGKTVTTIASINQTKTDQCHSFNGWWWKGEVTLKWYLPNSSKTKTTYCSVPEKNEESNWVVATSEGTCFVQE
jgi:hypothetical protein